MSDEQTGTTTSFMSAAGSIMPKTTPDDFYEGYIRPSKHRELSDILEQLRNYPTPVSDSDEEFNHLLAERDRLQKGHQPASGEHSGLNDLDDML